MTSQMALISCLGMAQPVIERSCRSVVEPACTYTVDPGQLKPDSSVAAAIGQGLNAARLMRHASYLQGKGTH